eukprot:4297647-Ditylum_brightwellii.AAC.1
MNPEYAAARTASRCFQQCHIKKKRDQNKSKYTACLPPTFTSATAFKKDHNNQGKLPPRTPSPMNIQCIPHNKQYKYKFHHRHD